MRASKRKAESAPGFVVRVGGRYVTGFRYLTMGDPKRKDRPMQRGERTIDGVAIASHAVALLGDGPPYRWSDEVAALNVALWVGGAYEPARE